MTLVGRLARLKLVSSDTALADILGRIQEHKVNRLDELLPWNWSPLKAPETAPPLSPSGANSVRHNATVTGHSETGSHSSDSARLGPRDIRG